MQLRAAAVLRLLRPVIVPWARGYLLGIQYSGSFVKGTSIIGGTDLDLFVSLSANTPDSLADIHRTLFNALKSAGFNPRRQNVSIKAHAAQMDVDLVPGKRWATLSNDHSLFRRKSGTWTKTNVHKHVAYVQNSRRVDEIRAIKIWRQLHGLDFPSFYLELAVIKALQRRPQFLHLADNVEFTLEYLSSQLEIDRIQDPANTNNIVSDDLTKAEKCKIASQAASALKQLYWDQIIW